ncbi:tail terminator [Arthrobacter phage Aoka]|nr:tail terminator [Arthrobacter phage Aoka]
MSRWPDLEKALVDHVREATGGKRTGTLVPGDVETLPAFVRIARGPGTDDLITDAPTVDVEAFAPKYGDAASLAEDVREIFHALPGRRIGPVLIDRVRTIMSPSWVDYRNPDTVRVVASYRIEYRQA